MNDIRAAFLETSDISRQLLGSDALGGKWDEPSALAQWSVRGLAGHLVRGTTSVAAYLDRGVPDADPISAPAYYRAAVGDEQDITTDLHAAVRQKGEDMAAGGREEMLRGFDEVLARLRERLEAEPEGRKVQVFKDLVLLLDDYLVTRLVELAIHIDDLAVSVGVDTPSLPPLATDASIDVLVGVGRLRHGDMSILRALARRERDDIDALRVL